MTAGERDSMPLFCQQRLDTIDVAADQFGVERDGRERVLDLVRDAAGDLFPGALLLRAKDFGDVFKGDDVAKMVACGTGLQQGHDSRNVQRAGRGRKFQFGGGGAHAVAALHKPVQRLRWTRRAVVRRE